jgi:cation/acetate symporter
MAFITHSRLVNPRLGTYYGIFAAAVAALFFLLLILEQLGVTPRILRGGMLLVPIACFIAIGVLAWTNEPLEFFASGRRVPAVFSGLVLALTAFGATGVVALTGALFTIGFDALCLVIGGIAGFVVMATAIGPYLRKVGAFTVPSFLGRRLRSRGVRLVAAGVMAVPILLLIAAEIRLGAQIASWLTGRPTRLMVPLIVLSILAIIIAGGMRSLTWSSVAQAILTLLAVTVPVGIIGVFETNLPIPQLSHGPTLRLLGRNEIDQGLAVFLAAPLGVEFPAQGLAPVAKRFANAFGSVGSLGFSLMSLSVMAGIAAAPWLLPRLSTVPTVYEARKSIGWAAFLFGVLMITLASVAVFMRDVLMELATSGRIAASPYWLKRLIELGWVQIPSDPGQLPFSRILVERDATLFALPVAAGMPVMLLYLALAGAIAAALSAAANSVMALGSIIAEDVIGGLSWEPPPNGQRLTMARIALIAAGIGGGTIALVAPADPLRLLLWAIALSASAGFPVLILAVWWKRLNAWGAMAGMATGFGVAVLTIIVCEAGNLSVNSALAAVLGVPCALVAAMLASYLSPHPDRHVLEMTRDMRVPGGETVFDREMRLMRLRQRQRG